MATVNAINNISNPFTVTGALLAGGVSFDSGTTSLGAYAATTFTPTISFAGGTTGITYGTQSGYYVKLGSIVFYSITIILTSKGSDTGQLRISSWPFAPIDYCFNDSLMALNASALGTGCITYTSGGDMYVFYGSTTSTGTVYSDVKCSDTQKIISSGFYFV